MKKNLILVIVVAVVVGAVAFFAGSSYGKSQALTPQALQSLTQQQRQALFAGAGARISGGPNGQRGQGGGFISGNISAVSADSITVQSRDGSSKIVFFSGSTEISKNASGTAADLVAGKSAMVQGSANQDGSVTATSIQLRPATGGLPGGAAPSGGPMGN